MRLNKSFYRLILLELINYVKEYLGEWNGVPVYTDFYHMERDMGQSLDTGSPIFAVYHDTGNPGSTAQQNVDYYKNTYDIDWATTASAHFFVDDKECIICVPLDEKAWHVIYDTPTDNYYFGDDANDAALVASYVILKMIETIIKST